MNRDRIASRGRRTAPNDGGSGSGPDNQGGGGRERPYGASAKTKNGNWFARHKVLSIVMVAVVAVGLVATGVIVNAMNNAAAILQNRTTPPAAGTPSATDWSDVELTGTPAATDEASAGPIATDIADPNYQWDKNTVNILVLGTDANAVRVKQGMNARTDCIMLVSINIVNKTASLISIPRDVYVKIYNAKNKVSAKNRINAAFTFGGGLKKNGIPYAMNTVNQFLSGGKIPIDHYVLFDMDLVKDLINAVGGVEVDCQISAEIHGVKFKKGMMHMTGAVALIYARDRHNTAGGDVGRVGHQQQVMIALLKKLKDTNTVVQKIPELYKAFIGNLTTDMMDPIQILALAFVAKDMDLNSIKQYTIKGEGMSVGGASMIVADQSYKQQVMQEVFGIKVPIDSSWTLSRLKGEIEAKLNAGKAIINTANSFLSNNAGYYTDDEASGLKNAISSWSAYSKKNDTDNAADAQQDVQTQYEALKIMVDNRKAAIQTGKDKIRWAQDKLSDLSSYISDGDKSTINSYIDAVQACVNAKDYNGVGDAVSKLDSDAVKKIFNDAQAAKDGSSSTDTPTEEPPTDTPATDPPATDSPPATTAA